jgi:hypothetical protein
MDALAVINEKLQKIDMSKIVNYSDRLSKIDNLSQSEASLYLQDFLVAYDAASYALSVSTKCLIEAKTQLDNTRSEAYFDRAPSFLKSKGVRDSSEARKKYEEKDEQVIKAKNIYSKAEAMNQLLKNKLMVFRYAYEALKKIYFSGDNNNKLPYEGMN